MNHGVFPPCVKSDPHGGCVGYDAGKKIKGRVEQVGDPRQVYDVPASPFLIEFLGNVNRLESGFGKLGVTGKDVLYVRPHDVDIRREYVGENALRAQVLHIFSAGNYGRVTLRRLDTGEGFEAEVPRDRLQELKLADGDEVLVVFRHVRLFPKGQFFETDVKEQEAAVPTHPPKAT